MLHSLVYTVNTIHRPIYNIACLTVLTVDATCELHIDDEQIKKSL